MITNHMKLSEFKNIIKEEFYNVVEAKEGPYDVANAKLAKMAGVKDSESASKNTMKVDAGLLKYPKYAALPDLDKDEGHKYIFLPSLETGDASTYIYSKESAKRWIDAFKKKYNEAPKFSITDAGVEVLNDEFVNWRKEYSSLKSKAFESMKK